HLIDGAPVDGSAKIGQCVGTIIHRALELGDALPPGRKRREDLFHAWAVALVGSHSRDEDLSESRESLTGRQVAVIAARTAGYSLQRLPSAAGEIPQAFRELLDAPGESEVAFVLSVAGWQITGRFDRVIERSRGLEIVDWKTDAGSVDEIVERYREQVLL